MGVTVWECYQHILVQSGSKIWQQELEYDNNELKQRNQLCQFKAHWQFEEEATGDPKAIVSAIGDGIAMAVSDGSFKEWSGAAAWTIEGADANTKVTGMCLVPGSEEDHSAYRSELMGLLGIMLTLYGLQEQSRTKTGSIRVCCDGKSALERTASALPAGAMEPHADLITAICNLRTKIPWRLKFQHM